MKQYKIISSTNKFLPEGITIPLDISNIKVGGAIQFLSEDCICTQDKGIITLVKSGDGDSMGNVYSIQEIEEVDVNPYPRKVTPETIQDLRINKEIDIFFETKSIMISPTDRVTQAHGITVEALYKFLEKEWSIISELTNTPFPLEIEENNNLVLFDEWNFSAGSTSFLKEGSWTRKKVLPDGRIQII